MATARQPDNDQQRVAVTFCETVHGRRLGRDFTRLMERWKHNSRKFVRANSSRGGECRSGMAQDYMWASSCEEFRPHNPLLEFPRAEIPTIQVVMIKNIITQYSIVVAASSSR